MKASRKTRDFRAELVVAQDSVPLILAIEDERVAATALPENVLREVEPRIGEEPRSRHPLHADRDSLTPMPDDAAEVPHGAPELERLRDREIVQRTIVGHTRAAVAEMTHEMGYARPLDAFAGRGPERRFHREELYRAVVECSFPADGALERPLQRVARLVVAQRLELGDHTLEGSRDVFTIAADDVTPDLWRAGCEA
jgi:hypothetical protein